MRRPTAGFRITLLLLLLTPVAVAAQEAQVPLDEDGRVEAVDRRLAERAGLFLDQYPDLEVVRLFQVDAGSFVLEVTLRRDGQVMRQRVPMDATEVAALRARVTRALQGRAPSAVLDQDGRFLLLGTTTLLGLGFYGWAVPAILDLDTGRGILASYMLTAGASFVIPYLYTKRRPVTYGMANAGFWGATRGIAHGTYLAYMLDSSPSTAGALGAAMTVSLAEGLGGYSWARASGMSAGEAHVIGNFGDFGHAWAGMGLVLLQPGDDGLAFAALLAGSAAGLAVGARRAPRLPYSWGDAEVQRAGFWLGAANGAAVWDWLFGDDASDDDVRALAPFLLAGSTGGLVAARRSLDGRDFSAGQGILIDLGTVAGGLLGLGVAALVAPDEDPDETLFITLGTLGADIGFAATLASLADDAERRARDPAQGRLDLDVNPGALLLLGRRRPDRAPAVPLPAISVTYRF